MQSHLHAVKGSTAAADFTSVDEGSHDQTSSGRFARGDADGTAAGERSARATVAERASTPEEAGLGDPGPYTGPRRRRFHREHPATLPAPPASSEEIGFGVAPPSRAASHYTALTGLLVVMAAAIAFIVTSRPSGSVTATAAAATAFSLPALFMWSRLVRGSRRLLAGGTLRLNDGMVELEHPGFFDGRLELPLSMVRAAAIDDRPDPDIDAGVCMRFPVFDRDPASPRFGLPDSYLWVRRRGGGGAQTALPQIGTAGELPNFALVFEAPVLMAGLRREPIGGVHDPGARGLILRVEELGQVRRLFARAGVLRPLTTEDID